MKNKIILLLLFSASLLFGANGPSLEIKKVASPQYVEGNHTVNYFIVVTNTSPSANPPDYDITINDDIDDIKDIYGTDYNLDDLNITIIDDANLSCTVDTSNTSGEIICTGPMINGGARIIQYSIIAPNFATQMTNTATLSTSDDEDFASSEVTVTVFPSFESTNYERDLCYEAPDYTQTCDRAGGFFYGSDCETSVVIRHTTSNELSNLHIFKSYTSNDIYKDSCYIDSATNTQCDDSETLDNLLHVSSSTYLENAFEAVLDFSYGNMSPDQNFTITDINARRTDKNNPNPDEEYIDYIVLIAQYQRADLGGDANDNTIEEYIYPCDSGYGVPPRIEQDTSAAINDVDMTNATLSTLNQATYIPYGNPGEGYKKVGTKIVKQPFVVGVTYLDNEGKPAVYNGVYLDDKDKSKTIDASVVIRYSSSEIPTDVTDVKDALWGATFEAGSSYMLSLKETDNPLIHTTSYPQIDEAFRSGTLEVKFVDYANFFNQLGGYSCTGSATNSSLCLVPACLNSDIKILEIFPIEHYPKVATCVYGDGAGAAPCDSNAYTGNCGEIKLPISPERYNHDLGCAECLADAAAPTFNSDQFSVRPYGYSYSIINNDGDDPYRAGKNYPIEINATTADNNDPQSDFYRTDLVGYNPPTAIAAIGLDYNASLSCPYDTNESQSINFGILAGGNDNADATLGGYADNDINYIRYSNVGVTTLTIMDQEWTLVDQNGADTDNYECIFDDNISNPSGDPFGRVGCKVWLQEPMTFVPFTFDIEANLTNHNTSANFTYLNDFNTTDAFDMAASLTVNVSAMNGEPNATITTNYIDGCYAKDNNLSLTFNAFKIAPTDSGITHMLYHNVNDVNTSNVTSISLPPPLDDITSLGELQNTSASFLPVNNGTANLAYQLNFNRKIDNVVQAFAMNLTDVNMTDTDNVEGNQTGITGQTAFMHYAKARPSVGIGNTYETVNPEVVTPILIHVYCKKPLDGGTFSLDFPNCTDLSLAATSDAGADWWLSAEHNANTDGNITLKEIEPTDIEEGAGTPSLSYTIIAANNGKDDDLEVARGPNPTFPLTVNIELADTSDEWLIHNPFNIPVFPSPFYKVKFITPSTWVGVGGTGSVVDTDVNTNTNKRMNW